MKRPYTVPYCIVPSRTVPYRTVPVPYITDSHFSGYFSLHTFRTSTIMLLCDLSQLVVLMVLMCTNGGVQLVIVWERGRKGKREKEREKEREREREKERERD